MRNTRLMDRMVVRNLKGGYSNVDGEASRMVIQAPVASVNYDVNTTVAPANTEARPVVMAENVVDAGKSGATNNENEMLAGDEVPKTNDSRTKDVVMEKRPAPAPKRGMTDGQKTAITVVSVAFGVFVLYQIFKTN